MEKQRLRREMLRRRLQLPPEERRRLSARAQEALIQSRTFARAGLILVYQPFRGEVQTEQIVRDALAAGKRLALPRVRQEPRGLTLHAYSGDPATLVRGAYGIREPDPASPQIDPAEIGLVVVPGVAFDRTGVRLGYGGGYYDRTLPVLRAANPSVALIGLAYAFQVVDALPRDPHDIPVDGVATDEGLIRCRG